MPSAYSRVFALTALALAVMPLAAPASAAPAAGWSAALQAPLAAPRQEIINGVLWKCAGTTCVAPAQGSRPAMVCQKLARKLGPVARFTSPDGELRAEDLARCNG